MKTRTKHQMIMQNGKPAFVVLPYKEFVKLCPETQYTDTVPHEVVQLMVKKRMSRARAWREYLRLTQKEVASRMGISQAALSQLETAEGKLRKSTLEKLAKALDITIEQLY